MEKLYYNLPYVKSFEAEVVSCIAGKEGTYEVVLGRTGFYPEGGGQPGDTGSLGEAVVLDVHEKDERIVHIMNRPLEAGTVVTGLIDWDKRYGNMQNHSGEHLFSGLVHKTYGYDNIGFHMGKDEITVDFNGILTMDQTAELELAVNKKIYENLPIVETYPSKEELDALEYRSKKELTGQVRIIEVPDCDTCACCGTHVMRTGEIGLLKVTGMIHYKGGVRISLLCGMRALEDYRRKQDAVSAISVLLSAKPSVIVEAVTRLKEESSQKEGRQNQLYLELFAAKAAAYPASPAPLIIFEQGLDSVRLRQFCTLLYEQEKGGVVLLCSGEDGDYKYACGSSHQDMRALSKRLNGTLSGRGGGSRLLAQGTFGARRNDIIQAMNEE